jgi:hypothetical protein
MENEILNILIILLVVALIWTVVKLAFKLTAKVFSCGCLGLVALAGLWIVLNGLNFF